MEMKGVQQWTMSPMENCHEHHLKFAIPPVLTVWLYLYICHKFYNDLLGITKYLEASLSLARI